MADVRLIDANELHEFLEIVRQAYLAEDTFSSDFAAQVIETVQDEYLALAPTVDAVKVVHGRWEKHKTMHGFVYCSACRDVYLDAEWLADGKWTYCPNCGAKMDLEV